MLRSFLSIKYSSTYSNIYIYIYIFYYLVIIDFILHHTPPYVFDIYLVELFIYKLIFLSLPSYEYMVTYIVGSIFI